MKIRDLGKAILDFELNTIPKLLGLILAVLVGLLVGILHWVVNLYKSLWWLILIICGAMFFFNLEKDCENYCSSLIALPYNGYAIHSDFFVTILFLLVGVIASFKLEKKLAEIKLKYFG